jgi:hypothetical protein
MVFLMKLIVTIDTEEDNWGQYDLTDYTLENIEKIDVLQELFDRYGVTPTYLVTYPVATDNGAIYRLRRIMEDGRCEIGTHCHPWNTPPFEEARNDRNSMLCNLAEDLQYKKIGTLHQAITRNFGVVPTSFRAGRWGFGESTACCLSQLGYKVDSSIMAFQNWKVYEGPDYSDLFPRAFTWEKNEGLRIGPYAGLLEMPATAGFTQRNFKLCNQVWQLLGGELPCKLHLRGFLDRLGMLNKIWLSPETSSARQMVKLTTSMMHQGYDIVNMFFHSTALKAGLSSFVKTREDEDRFLRRIEEFLLFTRIAGIESIKLSAAPAHLM